MMTDDFNALFISICTVVLGWFAIATIRRNDRTEMLVYGSATGASFVIFAFEFLAWRNLQLFDGDATDFLKLVVWTCPVIGAAVGATVEARLER